MTEAEGRGVQVWVRLANEALARINRADALEMIRQLPLEDRAAMMATSSAAGRAVDGETGGNLFYEVAAEDARELASVEAVRQ